MTRVRFTDLFACLLCIIPFVAWFIIKDSLPEQVPIHWNVKGDVDGWASNEQLPIFLLTITGIGALTYLTLRFITRIDPKRSAKLNETIALKVGIAILTFMTVINLLLLMPRGDTFNVTTVVLVMVSLLFTFLGNLMYNIKPNYFIGIRLPWTLENEQNWRYTHRLAGILWFIGGIVNALLTVVIEPNLAFPIFIGITMLLVLIPTVYSFMIFRRTKQQQRTETEHN